jgi:hypothetical protein
MFTYRFDLRIFSRWCAGAPLLLLNRFRCYAVNFAGRNSSSNFFASASPMSAFSRRSKTPV